MSDHGDDSVYSVVVAVIMRVGRHWAVLTHYVTCVMLHESRSRACGQLPPFFSSIERFDLIWDGISLEPQGKDDMEPTQFLEIFHPFTAIRSLYVSRTLVPFIAPALQELIGESTTEVLPNLHDLSLGGATMSASIQEDIQPFMEARRLSSRHVAVHHWGGYPGDE
jgi:hypothetical protein